MSLFNPDELRGLGIRLRVADLTLELVAAAIAAPQVANAAVVEILAPFRSKQCLTALRTGDDGTGPLQRASTSRSEFHEHLLVAHFFSPPDSLCPTLVTES